MQVEASTANGKIDDKITKEPISSMLGGWAFSQSRLEDLRQSFLNAQPFPHVVIENFFNDDIAARIESRFPKPIGSEASEWISQGWHVYDNPIEGKLAKDNIPAMTKHDQIFGDVWELLQSNDIVDLVKKITDIPNLETDPHLHGAGLHYHPKGSRLEMHLDYSIHPISCKERRVNLIIYLNKNWSEDWAGHLQLWGSTKDGMTQCVSRVSPNYNQAILMQTSDLSWHGVPEPVNCPDGTARQSMAIYYVSDPRPQASPRLKASFRPRPPAAAGQDPGGPGEEEDVGGRDHDGGGDVIEQMPGYLELCRIRDSRLLTKEDVHTHTPEWKPRWS